MEVSEVRRLHVVYFLSRKGCIEHPHLIRVHHQARNGIRLCDIKRWLGELRGKDMPESFSWSYKRRYKTGYVWQDLLDDDLITAISDNEYVLKGSEISHTKNVPNDHQDPSCLQEEDNKKKKEQSYEIHSSSEASMFASSEIEEESPTFASSETSTLTADSIRIETGKMTKSEQGQSEDKANIVSENAVTPLSNGSSSSSKPQSKSRLSKNSTSNSIFRSLITCGAVDTKDSAVVRLDRRSNRPLLNMCSGGDTRNVHSPDRRICARDRLGGSHRVFGNPSWAPQQRCSGRKSFDAVKGKSELRDPPCTTYAPINGPNCAQCGKAFKPEKLHSHMKSCKGMKAAIEKAASAKSEFRNRDSNSGELISFY